MGTLLSWFTTITLVFAAILLFVQLGIDVPTMIRGALGVLVHALATPLFLP